MSKRKHADDEPNFHNMEDAKNDAIAHIIGRDCDGAIRNDRRKCILARSMRRSCHLIDAYVLRNVAYGLRRGHKKWERWMIDHEGTRSIASFDHSGIFPQEGIMLRLIAPHGVRTLEYLRSPEFKALRAKSAEARKGKPKRATRRGTPGSLQSLVRWGRGKHRRAA